MNNNGYPAVVEQRDEALQFMGTRTVIELCVESFVRNTEQRECSWDDLQIISGKKYASKSLWGSGKATTGCQGGRFVATRRGS
jgi:hypothetical protein